MPLTIFVNRSILNIWQGSEYSSDRVFVIWTEDETVYFRSMKHNQGRNFLKPQNW